MAEYGFDLTYFDRATEFKKVLKENKLSEKATKKCIKSDIDPKKILYCQFEWKDKDVKLVTGSNPITGVHGLISGRGRDVGYASYMGIEGKQSAVKKLAKSIKKHASSIKGENPKEREFI